MTYLIERGWDDWEEVPPCDDVLAPGMVVYIWRDGVMEAETIDLAVNVIFRWAIKPTWLQKITSIEWYGTPALQKLPEFRALHQCAPGRGR